MRHFRVRSGPIRSFFRRELFGLCVLAGMVPTSPAAEAPPEPAPPVLVPSPLSPQQSLEHLRLAPGLTIELAANEPQVIDPVAIAFDEDGRMWVVEMTDYPNGPAAGDSPKSRVRVLEDTDGDGHFETATTFVDQLLFATGLQLWNGGAFVTLAGKVEYFRDTTGDGQADLRETWYTGFAQENEQLRANHPTLGLDNRIYIANGLRGGKIVGRPSTKGKSPERVSISGRDFRFDPRSGDYEAVSGQGQFGLTFDDFGNRFVCSNRNPAKHIVLRQRYVGRNPLVAVPAVTWDVSPAGAAARVFPLSRNWSNHSSHAGTMTSACGVLVFRGDALPRAYQGNLFVCEPVGNLVHRRKLIPDGATFRAIRLRDGIEFLSSPDDWFRPVNLTFGPDGALYVVDMYRAVVEHPHWLAENIARRLPFNAGDDRGRIYRILADPSIIIREPPRLSKATSSELVHQMAHPNAWWRETAARLIYQRQDPSAQGALEAMVASGQTALARIHALWALKGLGRLGPDTVMRALNDPHPRVCEQALILSEPWLDSSSELRDRIHSLADTSDARLRFQIALTLGQAPPHADTLPALQRMALHKEADAWTRLAVMTSLENPAQMLLEMLAKPPRTESLRENEIRMMESLSHQVGAQRDVAEIGKVLEAVLADHANPVAQRAVFTELAQGVAWRNGSFAELVDKITEDDRPLGQALDRWISTASGTAEDESVDTASRAKCLQLLRYVGFNRAGATLIKLARNAQPQGLRLAAIGILASYDEPEIERVLLADFRAQTPVVRRSVLDGLLASPQRTRRLLDELAQNRIALSELSPAAVQKLLNHPRPEIKQQAERLLASAIPADRQQTLADYAQALVLDGDPARGRPIFEKNCAECHRINQIGTDVGPYIGDFTLQGRAQKNPSVLLESILNPNRAIDANYVSYSIATVSGQVHTGIISEETATSVTLKQARNKRVTVLRKDIDAIRSNGISLMPIGFEKNINVQQMADLMAFLHEWRFLDGLVPLETGAGS